MLAQASFKVHAMGTLSERIKEAIETSDVSPAEIAKACGVSVQAVYDWLKGDTKELMGVNLVELAEVTGFEARWIAKEIGPKRRIYARTREQAHVLQLMDEMNPYQVNIVVKIADTVSQSPDSDEHDPPRAA